MFALYLPLLPKTLRNTFFQFNIPAINKLINATPEKDVDRTSSEGKASSVQFVHFNFTDEQIKKFKDNKVEVIIGIDHEEYSHFTKISETTRIALSFDFS